MVEVQYFGHSFFKLSSKNGSIIIDPIFNSSKSTFEKQANIPAKRSDFGKIDLILLTNDMLEHFDKEAVEEIAIKSNAVVIAHDSILSSLNIPRNLKTPILQSNEIFLNGFKIKPTTAHCPQSFCPTGFLIDCNGKKIYHAGVTMLLENFSDIKTDVAILPLSNRSMDVVDMVRAAKIIKPSKLIPMQYDIFEKTKHDPVDLKKRINESVLKTETIILKPGKKMKF
jgi:L-ascorbate metabolism protein UlaG (beta-lactamase superfamily)